MHQSMKGIVMGASPRLFAPGRLGALELSNRDRFADNNVKSPHWRRRLRWSRLSGQVFRLDKWSLCWIGPPSKDSAMK
jgi:hypothetical protein